MILGMSRFKVANGMERQVKEAFFNRPHLVDNVPGFLGMETFTAENDPAAFYLLTRWTDAASFRSWHSSPAHHQSHKGIPKGLKLDPTFTEVTVLERLADEQFPSSIREQIDDAGELLSHAIAQSETLYFVVCTPEGVIVRCNPAFAHAVGGSPAEIAGAPLWEYIADADRTLLRARVAPGPRATAVRSAIRFAKSGGAEFTLHCWIDQHPTHFTLLGELPSGEGNDEALYALNNELTVLAREHARTGKELAAAKAKLEGTLQELDRSYWHLRKIAEVLPICSVCGKVDSGGDGWQTVVEFLRENSLFLSHGYCPDCGAQALLDMEESTSEK